MSLYWHGRKTIRYSLSHWQKENLCLYPPSIHKVKLLGYGNVPFEHAREGLRIYLPAQTKMIFVFKINKIKK